MVRSVVPEDNGRVAVWDLQHTLRRQGLLEMVEAREAMWSLGERLAVFLLDQVGQGPRIL